MPTFKIRLPSSQFNFRVRRLGLGSHYLNPAAPVIAKPEKNAPPPIAFNPLAFDMPTSSGSLLARSAGMAGMGSLYRRMGRTQIPAHGFAGMGAGTNDTLRGLGQGSPIDISSLPVPNAQINQMLASTSLLNNAQMAQDLAAAGPPPGVNPYQYVYNIQQETGIPVNVPSSASSNVGSWFSGSTSIGGKTVSNTIIAAGVAIVAVVAMMSGKKRR